MLQKYTVDVDCKVFFNGTEQGSVFFTEGQKKSRKYIQQSTNLNIFQNKRYNGTILCVIKAKHV